MLNPEGSVDRGEERKNHSRLPVGGVTGTCTLFTSQLCMFVRVLYMDLRMCVVCMYIYLCMCISVRLCACRCVPAPICAHMYLYVCVLCRHVCSCVHLLVYMEAFGLKPGGRGIVTGC